MIASVVSAARIVVVKAKKKNKQTTIPQIEILLLDKIVIPSFLLIY